MNLIKYTKRLYWRFVATPEKYARHIGVKIGKGCFISTRDWSTEPYLVTIGDFCQITRGVKIFTHGGGQAVRSIIPDFDCFGKVTIGNYVYIGNDALIMPGVTICDNVLVAAGSVVTKSIPEGVVVGGNPARIICRIDDYLKKNLQYNTASKGMTRNQKKKMLLLLEESKFVKKPFMSL